MLEEFAASLTSNWFATGASVERLLSPPVAPQLRDEDPTVAATQLEEEDPAAVDSCALRTPLRAPFTRLWALRRQLSPLFTAGGHPPSEVSNDTAKRRLNNFINEVTRKRDSLIREPPKQPPAKPVLPRRSRRLAAQSLSRVPAFKRGEVLIMHQRSISAIRVEAGDI
jgi:hypothetical protein